MSLRRKFLTFATVVGVALVGGGFASAGTSGTQTVTFQIVPSRGISVANDTIAFGQVMTTDSKEVEGSTTTSAISWYSEGTADKITVSVASLASNLQLDVKGDNVDDASTSCAAPGTLAGGDGGYVTDIETERDFITAIDTCPDAATDANVDTVTYRLVSSGAAVDASRSKTVTYTIKA